MDEAHEHAVKLEAPGEAGEIARRVRRTELAIGAHERRQLIRLHLLRLPLLLPGAPWPRPLWAAVPIGRRTYSTTNARIAR